MPLILHSVESRDGFFIAAGEPIGHLGLSGCMADLRYGSCCPGCRLQERMCIFDAWEGLPTLTE